MRTIHFLLAAALIVAIATVLWLRPPSVSVARVVPVETSVPMALTSQTTMKQQPMTSRLQTPQASSTLDQLGALLNDFDGELPVAQFDEVIGQFLNDASIPRREKLDYLWDYACSASPEKAEVALDILRALRPIELATNLIGAFDGWHDSQKHLLLDVLRRSAMADEAQFAEAGFEQIFTENAPKVQEFIKGQLENRTPADALRLDLLKAYCDVSTPEAGLAMLNQLAGSWFNDYSESMLPDQAASYRERLQEWYRNAIGTALSSQETLNQSLPGILDQVRQLDTQNGLGIDDYLYALTEQSHFTGQPAETVWKFLAERQPAPAADSRYYHWLNSLAILAADGQNLNRASLLSQALQAESEPLNLASAVIYGGG